MWVAFVGEYTPNPGYHHVFLGVSKNNDTPKSSNLIIGFSIIFTIHFGFFPPYFRFNTLNRVIQLPSRELTYPPKLGFEDDFPFPKVGYVNPLEGIHLRGKFTLPGGATSLKEELVERVPVLRDAGSFREARRIFREVNRNRWGVFFLGQVEILWGI